MQPIVALSKMFSSISHKALFLEDDTMDEQNAADQAANEEAGVIAVSREESFQRALNQACGDVPRMPRYDCLKDWQIAYLRKIVVDREPLLFVTAPTGAGKSTVPFLTPHVYKSYESPRVDSPAIVIIISPFVGLIQDQVDILRNKHSLFGYHYRKELKSNDEMLDMVQNESLVYIFMCPETIMNNIDFFTEESSDMVKHVVAYFIDEAQEIVFKSDFRKQFLEITKLGYRKPVVLMSGTALNEVRVGLSDAFNHVRNVEEATYGRPYITQNRPNLFYSFSTVKSLSKSDSFPYLNYLLHLMKDHKYNPAAFPKTVIYFQNVTSLSNLWKFFQANAPEVFRKRIFKYFSEYRDETKRVSQACASLFYSYPVYLYSCTAVVHT